MGNSHQLLLTVLPGTYAIARFAPQASVPFEYASSFFYSVSKTDQELSVVCEERFVAADVKAERKRRLIRVESTLAFSLTGIVAFLSGRAHSRIAANVAANRRLRATHDSTNAAISTRNAGRLARPVLVIAPAGGAGR